MNLFLCYDRCSTCRKAEEWLNTNGVFHVRRSIREDNPTADELKTWIAASGLPIRRFFNTSGLLYKELGLRDRLPSMDEEEMIRLLASDGMLVRRPLLITDSAVLVGFRPEEWSAALLGSSAT